MTNAEVTVRELLAMHETALAELRARGVVRTNDSPSGQYAEWLAQQVLGGELAPNSEKSFDLTTSDGVTLQVKCRVLRNGSAGERQLSPFPSFDFDQALVILFDPAYDVLHAVLLSADLAQQLSRWSAHVNGYLLTARSSVLEQGVDVTARFAIPHD